MFIGLPVRVGAKFRPRDGASAFRYAERSFIVFRMGRTFSAK